MTKQYVIVAPIPELPLPADFGPRNLGTGVVLAPLKPDARRALLDAAKQQGPASNDLLDVIIHSESVAIFDVPEVPGVSGTPLAAGAMYRDVADLILSRIGDCTRLFGDVPLFMRRHSWFFASGSTKKIDLTTLMPTELSWTWEPTDGNEEPTIAATVQGIEGLSANWAVLTECCQLSLLNKAFADPRKVRGYTAAGNAEVKKRALEMAQAYLDEHPPSDEAKMNFNSFSAAWFITGYLHAYQRELRKLETRHRIERHSTRFHRAIQVFTDSFRIQEPHRLVARVTALEALLSHERGELTIQLAARLSWLLAPNSAKDRRGVFDKVKSFYDLRSKVVHGASFSFAAITKSESELLQLTRKALVTVIRTPRVFTALASGTNASNACLKGLLIGDVDVNAGVAQDT